MVCAAFQMGGVRRSEEDIEAGEALEEISFDFCWTCRGRPFGGVVSETRIGHVRLALVFVP